MKTSNKLLLFAIILFLVLVTAFCIQAKNGLEAGYNAVLSGNGDIITKDIGSLKSGHMRLEDQHFVIDPNSDRITVTGSSNIVEKYDDFFDGENGKRFCPDTQWEHEVDGNVNHLRFADARDYLKFNIGVKGINDLTIEQDEDIGSMTFSDTLILENISIDMESNLDEIEFMFHSKKASIRLDNWGTNMDLYGSTDYLYLFVAREATAEASQFKAKMASVNLAPLSNTNLNVSQSLLGRKHEIANLSVSGGVSTEGLVPYKGGY